MIIELPNYKSERNKSFVNIDRLDDDSIIVDAGACEADIIKDLRTYKQAAKCKIFAIECNKKLAEDLRKQNLFNVEICERALVGQNVEGGVMFFEGKRGANWGSIEPALLSERWPGATDIYEVKTLRINDIFNEFSIDKIDYMKMDIEGSEKLLLETMSMETAKKIKQITMEVHWPNPNAGITMEWARERLIEFGFEIKHEEHAEIFCERDE
jgi:FkbM family methyltransferase